MVNTVSTATENDKKQELLNMNWAEFSDEDKKDLASSLSIQNIDEYMNAIQSDDTIDAQKKEEILDNLLDVRKVREKMDNEGADAVVEQAKQITEMQTEKEEQRKNQLEQAKLLKNELNSEDKAEENKEENKETQEKVKEEVKEDVAEEVKEEEKEEVKEDVAEEVKEEDKEEVKEDVAEEVKEEVKEKAKEEVAEEVKEEVKEDPVDGQVDSLQAQLADKDQELNNKNEQIDSMQNDIKALREQLRELSNKNTQVLDDLKKAKNSKDKETIAKQEEEIRKLQAEKERIRSTYFGALPKYNGAIKELDTKWIEFKFLGNKSIDGQRVLTGPQLRFRQNLRSRKRINTTVRKLNEIGKDPKKGVQFVLTRTFGYDPLKISGKIGSGFKNMRKFFKIRDVKAFDEMYNKQKQYFIDDLESKMAANSMSEKDRQVIDSIKRRLDYYQAAYKRQFITA